MFFHFVYIDLDLSLFLSLYPQVKDENKNMSNNYLCGQF